jgi:hypothetical protein
LGFSLSLRRYIAVIAQCTAYSPVDGSRPRFWNIFTLHPSKFALPRLFLSHEIFIKTLKVVFCQTTTLERNDPTPSEAVRLCTDTAGRDLLDNILCDAALHLLRSLDSLLTPDLRGDLLLLLRLTECSKCGVVGVRSEDGQKFLR